MHNPSRRFILAIWRFIFFPSAGPSEGKGFQYFEIGTWGSPEELLGDGGAKFIILKEERRMGEKQKATI